MIQLHLDGEKTKQNIQFLFLYSTRLLFMTNDISDMTI